MCSKGGLGAVRAVATKPHRMFSGGGRQKRPEQVAAGTDPAAVTGGNAPVATQDAAVADRREQGMLRRRRTSSLLQGDNLQQRTLLTRLGGP